MSRVLAAAILVGFACGIAALLLIFAWAATGSRRFLRQARPLAGCSCACLTAAWALGRLRFPG